MRMLIGCLLVATASVALAAPTTPKPGSKERQAIMDALRKPVSREAGKPVIFEVAHLKVDQGYAFLEGNVRAKDGSRLPTEIADSDLLALLQRQKSGWRVLYHSFGTDIEPLLEVKRKFPKAPRTIFPGE
jgi:hypothetical protein